MPDLSAGTIVKAADTPNAVVNRQVDQYTATNTTFGVTTTGGTYTDCAVVFVAPTTGREAILYDASLDNSAAASSSVAPQVRTGSTIGSGTVVEDASLDNSVLNIGTDERRYGGHITLTGLTAGSSYNVRLLHRVSSGTGTFQRRIVTAVPLT